MFMQFNEYQVMIIQWHQEMLSDRKNNGSFHSVFPENGGGTLL